MRRRVYASLFAAMACLAVAYVIAMISASISSTYIPRSALPLERSAVERLDPFVESIDWNESGSVVAIDLRAHEISDDHVDLVLKLGQLEELGLAGDKLTDEGIVRLAELEHLRALSLQWSRVSDSAMPSIARIKTLALLDLNHTAITDRGIDDIVSLPQLETLFIEGTEVTIQKVESLRARMPNCRIQY